MKDPYRFRGRGDVSVTPWGAHQKASTAAAISARIAATNDGSNEHDGVVDPNPATRIDANTIGGEFALGFTMLCPSIVMGSTTF